MFVLPDTFQVTAAAGARGFDQRQLEKGRLRGFSITTGKPTDGSVYCTIRVGLQNRNFAIRRGWIRGSGVPGQRDALLWSGDIPVDPTIELEIDFQNDTGAEVTVVATHMVDE